MESVGFVPVLTMLTMIVFLALVWLNIQQTMDQLSKRRDEKGRSNSANAGSAMR